MVRLSIDNQVTADPQGQATSVEELVKLISSQIPDDRMISEVRCDGKFLSLWKEGALNHVHDLEEADLEVRTVSKERWAATGVDTAMSSLRQLQRSFAKTFETGLVARHLNQSLEALKGYIHQMEMNRLALGVDFDAIRVDTKSVSELLVELRKICTALVGLRDANEIEALEDKIGFELLSHLALWHKALPRLQACAESQSPQY